MRCRCSLPKQIGDLRLTTAETFGELDLRSLLRTFRRRRMQWPSPKAGAAAALAALHVAVRGDVAALALRWDTLEDAAEWRNAVPRYAAAAFPGATARDCPPLDRCWSSAWTVATGCSASTSVFASGPGSDTVAAAILAQG